MEMIRVWRKRKGTSQNKLSQAVGVTRSCICRYEGGSRTPNAVVLRRIADALHVRIDDLMAEPQGWEPPGEEQAPQTATEQAPIATPFGKRALPLVSDALWDERADMPTTGDRHNARNAKKA